jgi:hypothetical protein
MSQASIEHIIGKALLDADFRDMLLANPEQALSGFDLTEAEKTYLKRADAETLDELAALLAVKDRLWRLGIQSAGDHN